MTNGNQKGKAGERELSKELTRLFGVKCRRGQQYSGIDGNDVVGLPGVHVECKRVEKLNIDSAYAQSARDAKDDEVPIVCHRKNRGPWLVTLELDDLAKLATQLYLILSSDGE